MRVALALLASLAVTFGAAQAEPSAPKVMADIAISRGSEASLEYLIERFTYLLDRIDFFCPDLEGELQVGDVVVYMWDLLDDAAIVVPLESFTQRSLDMVGTFNSLSRNNRNPEHTCAWLMSFLYLLMLEQQLSLDDAYEVLFDYLFSVYLPDY